MLSIMKEKIRTFLLSSASLILALGVAGTANASQERYTEDSSSSETVAIASVGDEDTPLSEYYSLTEEEASSLSLEQQFEKAEQSGLSRNERRSFPKNTSSMCSGNPFNTVWYGMSAGRCKGAGGTKFQIYDTAKGKLIAEVDLSKVKPIKGEKLPTFGCIVNATGFALTIPGSPTSIIGWVLKGVAAACAAYGVVTSC